MLQETEADEENVADDEKMTADEEKETKGDEEKVTADEEKVETPEPCDTASVDAGWSGKPPEVGVASEGARCSYVA